jgi:hypothetical protein
MYFYNGTTTVSGSISVNGASATFNTSSDYRLKENVVNMTDAIATLKLLRPIKYNFIGDSDVVSGFLAHEVQEVIPRAVTGEKDGVDADGEPEYQGIDHSVLVPTLVGAVQELIAEVESLKTRLG